MTHTVDVADGTLIEDQRPKWIHVVVIGTLACVLAVEIFAPGHVGHGYLLWLLAVWFMAIALHEVLHLVAWYGLTGKRPKPVSGSLLAIGWLGQGEFTARTARIVLAAPAILIPAFGIVALETSGTIRMCAIVGLTALIAGSWSDAAYYWELGKVSPESLLEDTSAGYLILDGARPDDGS